MTEEAFTEWLRKARAGDKFAYAEAGCLSLAGGEAQRVGSVALRAFFAGTVDLVQQRLGGPPKGVFRYIAIKRQEVELRHCPHWLTLPKVAA